LLPRSIFCYLFDFKHEKKKENVEKMSVKEEEKSYQHDQHPFFFLFFTLKF